MAMRLFSVLRTSLIFLIFDGFAINAQNIETLGGYPAGNGQGTEMGGGLALSNGVSSPCMVYVDGAGDVYFYEAPSGYNRLRKLFNSNGKVITLAGYRGTGCCSSGPEGVLATESRIHIGTTSAGRLSVSFCIDASGNYYIADNSDKIRKVDAATGIINVYAGNGTAGFGGDGGAATSANLNNPSGVAIDAAGNIYISDRDNHRIRKVTAATGIISTIAGTGTAGFSGDGGAATSAQIARPTGIAVDGSGNIYFADFTNNRIRKITPGGIISTVAGYTATGAYSGDGGPATSADLNIHAAAPTGTNSSAVAVDAAGNFYIADAGNHRIRKVTVSTGVITTVAGTGTAGFNGDGISATTADLSTPRGVFVDGSGNIYIADRSNNRIRKVDAGTGLINTIAGNGTTSAFAVPSCSRLSHLWFIKDVAVDAAGNAYVCTNAGFNEAIWKITPDGTIDAVAGTGSSGYSGDGGLAVNAQVIAGGLTIDNTNNLMYFMQGDNLIRKVDFTTGLISTIAGTGVAGFSGDGGAATAATMDAPTSGLALGISLDASGNIYFADYNNHRIRKITVSTGIITTVAGNGIAGSTGDGGAATSANLNYPRGIDLDGSGNIYIADGNNHKIRKVNVATGIITTVAGDGTSGTGGDGGAATSAQFNFPKDVAVNRTTGDLYITDGSHRVRKVTAATGIINTFAGTGTSGYSGDGGAATSAQLNGPHGIAMHQSSGCIYIADWSNSMLRVVDVSGSCLLDAGNCVSSFYLPVELTSLKASCQLNNIRLDWATATELNNDYFSIERSVDNTNWIAIGSVKGAGNSSVIREYHFEDNELLLGNDSGHSVYYRLRQIDYNGQFELFGPIVTRCSNSPTWGLVMDNYVVNQILKIELIAPRDENIQIRILDISGRLVKNISLEATDGFNYYSIQIGSMNAGMYFLQIENKYGKQLSRKFIKE